MAEIRQPQKINSIEKKQKIIEAGLKAFSEKGYYNTTTTEIAQIAGVSTGIVYNYFNNKKDILLQALKVSFENTYTQIFNAINQYKFNCNFECSIREFILDSLQAHKSGNQSAHREIMGMCLLDQDAGLLLKQMDENVIKTIVKALINSGINVPNITTKAEIFYHILRDFCHTATYENCSDKDTNIMLKEIVEIAKKMFIV